MKNPLKSVIKSGSSPQWTAAKPDEAKATLLPQLAKLHEHLIEANQILTTLLGDDAIQSPEPTPAKPAPTNPHLTVAHSYEGLDEDEDTRRLETLLGVNPVSVPWCAAFVNACLRNAGLPTTASLRARDFATYGTEGDGSVGDIAVWNSHVAIVAQTSPEEKVIGGNQSNAVNISPKRWYDRYSKFLGYRKPPTA